MSQFAEIKAQAMDDASCTVEWSRGGIVFKVALLNGDVEGQRSARKACDQFWGISKDEEGNLLIDESHDATSEQQYNLLYEILKLKNPIDEDLIGTLAVYPNCIELYQLFLKGVYAQ